MQAAIYAQGIIKKMIINVVLVPKELPAIFRQTNSNLITTRFAAYYWTLKDHPELPVDACKNVYLRAASAYWKCAKNETVSVFQRGIFSLLFAVTRFICAA